MDQDGNQLYWAKGRIVKIQFSVFSFVHFDAFHIFKAQLYCRGTPGWTAMALHLHNLFSPDFQVEVGSLSKSCKKSADGIYKILYLQYIRCIYIYHYISSSFDSPGRVTKATPNLDAVDRALEELQRGLLEIDHVLAGPGPRLGLGSPRKSIGSHRKNGGFNGKIESIHTIMEVSSWKIIELLRRGFFSDLNQILSCMEGRSHVTEYNGVWCWGNLRGISFIPTFVAISGNRH